MKQKWDKLLHMTGGKRFRVSEVVLPEEGIAISGDFELPPLAELSSEEQIFVAAFIKTHGSIKQMESIFSISYPTVKNRLNAIAAKMDIVDVKVDFTSSVSTVLDRLEMGDIDVEEALREISS